MTNSIKSVYQILSRLKIYRLNANSTIDSELAAYDVGFRVIEAKIASLLNNSSPATADSHGLDNYEELLGFRTLPSAPLEARRSMIIKRMNKSRRSASSSDLYSMFAATGSSGSIYDGISSRVVIVTISEIISPILSFEEILAYINKVLPAHLDCRVVYGKLSFNMLDEKDFSWNTWDTADFEWNEFDLNGETLFD